MAYTISEAKMLLCAKPRAQLGFFPTPLYKLERLSEMLRINLYVKRDDFTGMNLFGGNKVRKLEYLLGQAQAENCEYVITYGATQSNHAMETVSGCRRCGLKPILYLTAVIRPDEKDVRSNLLLDRIMGAEIHIVDILPGETEDDADKRAYAMGEERARELNENGHRCMNIPMGGANACGSVGFAGGYVELREQLAATGIEPDYLYHATGTGGTLAGIAAGRALLGGKERVISINVSPKDEMYLPKVEHLANEVLSSLGCECRVDYQKDMCLDQGYYGPGYERPNEAASEAIKLLARTEGLLVDPVYTGKALSALLDHAKTGKIDQGSTVVFWHTGGATALFAEKEILGNIF